MHFRSWGNNVYILVVKVAGTCHEVDSRIYCTADQEKEKKKKKGKEDSLITISSIFLSTIFETFNSFGIVRKILLF